MNRGELRAATRTVLDDATAPYLWPDEDINRRLNNAVREACLRARLLRADADSDPDQCLLSVAKDTVMVALDPTILVVRSASLSDGARPLRMSSSDDMDKLEPGWDAGRGETGTPQYAVMDIAQKVLRLWPKPAADVTVQLRVWRVPTEDEQMTQDKDTPAVILPDAEELCHWAAYECYMVADSETFNANAAAEHLQMFTHRFGQRPNLHEMARWADTPPRVRHAHMF